MPLLLLLAACGHADAPAPTPADAPSPAAGAPSPAAPASTAAAPDAAVTTAAASSAPRCAPATEGSLRARLQGDVDAHIDWSAPLVEQCLGGARPGSNGVRLVYRGPAAAGDPLLIVIGIGVDWSRGERQSNVPANFTLVREGASAFYATQGDDKCALDELRREQIAGDSQLYRVVGRGYCTQPARALGDSGRAVLLTRFDVTALVQQDAAP